MSYDIARCRCVREWHRRRMLAAAVTRHHTPQRDSRREKVDGRGEGVGKARAYGRHSDTTVVTQVTRACRPRFSGFMSRYAARDVATAG